jgi:hypothetical protein
VRTWTAACSQPPARNWRPEWAGKQSDMFVVPALRGHVCGPETERGEGCGPGGCVLLRFLQAATSTYAPCACACARASCHVPIPSAASGFRAPEPRRKQPGREQGARKGVYMPAKKNQAHRIASSELLNFLVYTSGISSSHSLGEPV